MRYLVFSSLVVTSALSGCSLYYESQAKDMVQRQMDAMVFVEGGEFMMGNPGGWDGSKDSWPPHKVVLDDFYIQKYEVTQGDFELFMAVTGYEPSDRRYEQMRDKAPKRFAGNLPAVASWRDANAFCQWLKQETEAKTSLPTEAQWEFAARSRGRLAKYATLGGQAIPNKTMASGPELFDRDGQTYEGMLPLKPGTFPPNPLGLHDMSGNVSEWVSDKYLKDYYERSPVKNPEGPEEGQKDIFDGDPYRVVRGGNFHDFEGNTTVTRQKGSETLAVETRGFRCAMN
ncbi:formylglycine-generating enzyme family protein [Marinobacter sp.]|uniref:formylglycine-generating enzyme family protein n=1 Tax=Marinobacter sp. TaxID=50741 RepID=UPI003563FE01